MTVINLGFEASLYTLMPLGESYCLSSAVEKELRKSVNGPTILIFSFADPEVHIPLENLQQFPAFNSYTSSSDSALGPTSTEGHGAFSISPLSRSPGSQAGK